MLGGGGAFGRSGHMSGGLLGHTNGFSVRERGGTVYGGTLPHLEIYETSRQHADTLESVFRVARGMCVCKVPALGSRGQTTGK